MPSLYGKRPKDTFPTLLKLDRPESDVDGKHDPGLHSELRLVEDGLGNKTPLALSHTRISLNDTLWPDTQPLPNQMLISNDSGELIWAGIPSGEKGEDRKPDSATYTYNEDNELHTITEIYGEETRYTEIEYDPVTKYIIRSSTTYGGITRTEHYTYSETGKIISMTSTYS